MFVNPIDALLKRPFKIISAFINIYSIFAILTMSILIPPVMSLLVYSRRAIIDNMNVSQNQNNLRAIVDDWCTYVHIYVYWATHTSSANMRSSRLYGTVCPRYCYYYYYHDLGNGSYSVGGYIICESGTIRYVYIERYIQRADYIIPILLRLRTPSVI